MTRPTLLKIFVAGFCLLGLFEAAYALLLWYRTDGLPWGWARTPIGNHVPAHFIIPITVAPTVALLIYLRITRARAREASGRCTACGYDLRASPDRCPECGKARHNFPSTKH